MGPVFGLCGPINPGQDAFNRMKASGWREYRFDANITPDATSATLSGISAMLPMSRAAGVTLRPILFTPFQWSNGNATGVNLYDQGYRAAYILADTFYKDIDTIELGNEINLLRLDASGNQMYGKGWTAAEFDTPLMRNWALLLQGMTDAINKVNKVRGSKIHKTLGTTSTMFGFLDFMRAHKVDWTKIGYHYYARLTDNPHSYWGGVKPNFDLFKKLDSYGWPVTFNEVNAGEIYDLNDPNVKYDDAAANKSLAATIKYLRDGTFKNLESVLFYNLYDQPQKTGAEAAFGLLKNTTTEKPFMATIRKALS